MAYGKLCRPIGIPGKGYTAIRSSFTRPSPKTGRNRRKTGIIPTGTPVAIGSPMNLEGTTVDEHAGTQRIRLPQNPKANTYPYQ